VSSTLIYIIIAEIRGKLYSERVLTCSLRVRQAESGQGLQSNDDGREG
jgi:hypothetical protein